MTIDDFKNKRITVMGIGLHGGGVGVIKFLAAQGANILVTDLRTEKELKESLDALKDLPLDYVLGQHRLRDFTETEMIIKNPGVPENSKFLAAARAKNILIESDIGIFLELCPAPIIGITGTKGKSTTASLLAEILSAHFPQVVLAGNIRASVLEKLPQITKSTLVILELSSWQLADAKEHKKSPYVAIITNILPDHLNRYTDFQNYIDDKKLIFKFQKDKDYLFLNYADQILKEIAREVTSRIYFYSADGEALLKEDMPRLNQKARMGAYRKGRKIYYGAAREEICGLRDIKLIGEHNLSNVLAAISVADLYDVPREKIKIALRHFQGLEGRLQFIVQKNGVKYINDTTATVPDAAIAAINTTAEQLKTDNKNGGIILITGGADKNLNFSLLAETIVKNCKTVILLQGTANHKLEKAIAKRLPIKKTNDMQNAVQQAAKAAETGDTVLLSPGCASFGLFKHEFDRGEKFNETVALLKMKN